MVRQFGQVVLGILLGAAGLLWAVANLGAACKCSRGEDDKIKVTLVVVLASDELSGHVTGQVVVEAGGMEGRTTH